MIRSLSNPYLTLVLIFRTCPGCKQTADVSLWYKILYSFFVRLSSLGIFLEIWEYLYLHKHTDNYRRKLMWGSNGVLENNSLGLLMVYSSSLMTYFCWMTSSLNCRNKKQGLASESKYDPWDEVTQHKKSHAYSLQPGIESSCLTLPVFETNSYFFIYLLKHHTYVVDCSPVWDWICMWERRR